MVSVSRRRKEQEKIKREKVDKNAKMLKVSNFHTEAHSAIRLEDNRGGHVKSELFKLTCVEAIEINSFPYRD